MAPELQDNPIHLQMILCHNIKKLDNPVTWVKFPVQNPSAVKKLLAGVGVGSDGEQLSYYNLAQVGLKLKILPLSQVSVEIIDVCLRISLKVF